MVNLIRGRELTFDCLFLHTVRDNLLNVLVALVRDDRLGVVIHFFLAILDMLLNVLLRRGVELYLFDCLLVTLKELDCKPAEVNRIYLALNRLLNVRDCVLHGTREDMRELTLSVLLRELETQLCGVLRGLAFQCTHLDHRTAELFRELL